ncbi:hypothetical protein A2524_03430 [Candidatus Wolfebacteria bacterium RIFOXYD12_FULL_48_21]|nr:MAG: hypothetical protein A2524_03430 [Candidatus Wolfebacteria bacterium RIFOXYD12_FULL_48_21]OGM97255.1 MAG: hypothetical protein A2532_03230 [Candidatus Wolfebacteria bacterium RIFOXYD2_FULL_48_11]
MDAIRTKELHKHFSGVAAIDGLSVAFEQGKVTGVVGPNGSGKTTLVNVLSGMLPPTAGVMVIGGEREMKGLRASDTAYHGITRTFQEVRLFEQMTVLDNILVVLTERSVWGSLFERHNAGHMKKVETVLTRVGLWEKRSQLAHNLSYGQRKLLEIARVLAMTHSDHIGQDASIFLFDEPFAGLFPEMIKVIVSVIKELKEAGKTVILIEHNMNLIRELCDHLIVMDSGKLLAEGKPDHVLAKREVIEAYLGE